MHSFLISPSLKAWKEAGYSTHLRNTWTTWSGHCILNAVAVLFAWDGQIANLVATQTHLLHPLGWMAPTPTSTLSCQIKFIDIHTAWVSQNFPNFWVPFLNEVGDRECQCFIVIFTHNWIIETHGDPKVAFSSVACMITFWAEMTGLSSRCPFCFSTIFQIAWVDFLVNWIES